MLCEQLKCLAPNTEDFTIRLHQLLLGIIQKFSCVTNLPDILTKLMPSGAQHKALLNKLEFYSPIVTSPQLAYLTMLIIQHGCIVLSSCLLQNK